MLTDTEKSEILAERNNYPDLRIEALRIVQKHRGWISDKTLQDIAEFLGISQDQLDDAASFYNLIFRKPVGRHVIALCDSVSCWIMGSESLQEHLRKKLGITPGQTTEDGQFTLIPIACLGACDRAPAMMIDETLYTDLDPTKVDSILEQIRSEVHA